MRIEYHKNILDVRENDFLKRGSNFERIDVVICNLCKKGREWYFVMSFIFHCIGSGNYCLVSFVYLKNDSNSVELLVR